MEDTRPIEERAVVIITGMKPDSFERFPSRFDSDQKDTVRRLLKRRKISGITFTIIPTAEGGGTMFYRPPDRKTSKRR